MSVVYFMADNAGKIKIGTSRTLAKRHRALKAKYGDLELLGTMAGARKTEMKVHAQLAEHRIEGEWFRDCLELRRAIQCLCDGADHSVGAESVWADQEAQAIARIEDDYRWIERHCRGRGMTSGEAMDYVSETYSIPHELLWSVRYKHVAIPNAAVFIALREARAAELVVSANHIEGVAKELGDDRLAKNAASIANQASELRGRWSTHHFADALNRN